MSILKNPMLFHQNTKVVIEVTKSPFTIGRAQDCDYEIPNTTISRTHCRLEKTDEGWVLTDQSSNGTLVNGTLYLGNTSGVLKNLDSICLGLLQWTYKLILERKSVANTQSPIVKGECSDSTSESGEYANSSSLPDQQIATPVNSLKEDACSIDQTARNGLRSSASNSLSSNSSSNEGKSGSVTDQLPATPDENRDLNVARSKRRRTSDTDLDNKVTRVLESQRPAPQPQMHSCQEIDFIVDLTNDLFEDECMITPDNSKRSADPAKGATTSKTAPKEKFEHMETELICTICSHLFIKAVTLGCSHTFCAYCIKRWRTQSSSCPICRNAIKSVTCTLVLDNLVDKVMENASPEDRKQRQEAIAARQQIEQNPGAGVGGTKRRRRRRNVRIMSWMSVAVPVPASDELILPSFLRRD